MSTKSRSGSNAGTPHAHQQADLDSPDERAAPPAESRSEPGAPPSNTAPNTCNPSFQSLRWGVDSLYLSYPGELAEHREVELRKLKTLAQSAPHETAKAQLALGDHAFEVRDKSSGLFAFTLVDGAYMIRLASRRSKRVPMAYVQVSSGLLAYKTIPDILRELQGLLEALGDIERPRVSRADLYVDFCCDVDMESWDRNAWITKASTINQYAEDKVFTGWSIQSSALMARLYHKLIESKKSGKEYLHGLGEAAGWDRERAVWRLEFEFKREVLVQLGVENVPALLASLGGLWTYATETWLRLGIPSETDETRGRWPSHPLWLALSGIDWTGDGGPLLRSYKPLRSPSLEWLGMRAAAGIASVGAIIGERDFDAAAGETVNQAYKALSAQNGLSGISVEQFFSEKVEGLVRQYNMRMNTPPDDVPAPDEPILQNPYYRGKQGL